MALSVKAREIAEEKEAVQQYGSSDSGASLGDILGPAMGRAREMANADLDNAEDEDAEPDYGDTEVPVIETAEADNGAESKAEAAEENETGTDDDRDPLDDVSDNPKADT